MSNAGQEAPASNRSEPVGVVLLGATGSIGRSALAVLRANRAALRLVGVAAHGRAEDLAAIVREFSVPWAALGDAAAAARAEDLGLFPPGTQLLAGPGGLETLAVLPEARVVLVAVVGTAGLGPTLAAIRAGKDIALASKEILVLAGRFVTDAVRAAGVRLLPVDSEHNAIFQCLQGQDPAEVARLLLTASGGPFRQRDPADLAAVTVAEALAHPSWSMGPKITVDSATMANKGLEMVEAHWLFSIPPPRIEVVIHPQSIVHSMVEFVDGSVLAQLSPPSMTFAIQHALLHPRRAAGVHPTLDFRRALNLQFEPPVPERFPCLMLARQALEAGGTGPAVFNAANEVAVAAFLAGQTPFTAIPGAISHALSRVPAHEPQTLGDALEADRLAREAAAAFLRRSPPR